MKLRRAPPSRWLAPLSLLALLLLAPAPDVGAQQTGGLPEIEKRLAALSALTGSQSVQIAALQAALSAEAASRLALAARVAVLESRTQDMSRLVDPNTGQDTVRFTAVNVQIVNGTGTRDAPVNGLGNLIVGYNEFRGNPNANFRTGSHNLVVGDLNNYSSFGGLLAGIFNTVSGQYGSVTAGNVNTASGTASSVSGGRFNTASSDYASVSGGSDNTASSYAATVSGGFERNAAGFTDWAAGALSQDF